MEDGDGHGLAAGAGDGGVDVAVGVDGGVGDGMKVLGHRDGDAQVERVAGLPVAVEDRGRRRWCLRERGWWRGWGG